MRHGRAAGPPARRRARRRRGDRRRRREARSAARRHPHSRRGRFGALRGRQRRRLRRAAHHSGQHIRQRRRGGAGPDGRQRNSRLGRRRDVQPALHAEEEAAELDRDSSMPLGRSPQIAVRVDGLEWTYVESFYGRRRRRAHLPGADGPGRWRDDRSGRRSQRRPAPHRRRQRHRQLPRRRRRGDASGRQHQAILQPRQGPDQGGRPAHSLWRRRRRGRVGHAQRGALSDAVARPRRLGRRLRGDGARLFRNRQRRRRLQLGRGPARGRRSWSGSSVPPATSARRSRTISATGPCPGCSSGWRTRCRCRSRRSTSPSRSRRAMSPRRCARR